MLMKSVKGLTDHPTYKRNPYLSSLVVPSRNKTIAISNKQLSLFDPKTGAIEEERMTFMGLRKRVDTEEFVKIYKAQIQALFDLSVRSLKVFGYFMEATRISSDVVMFEINECKEYTGYKSKNTINLALAELLEKEFIARTPTYYKYYVNPAKFFNGDRLVLFQDVVRKGSKIDQQLQEHDPLMNLNQSELDLIENAK